MPQSSKILITGGAGFIGSNLVKYLVRNYPDDEFINLDQLTYAGNLENLKDIENKPNYRFIKGDINDEPFIKELFRKEQFNGVIHMAAESHVDRSIMDPGNFVKTNVNGTVSLLNSALELFQEKNEGDFLFHHVSTDEVYGSLGSEGKFTEDSPYAPNSPYASSKASSDHFVRAYHHTYHLPVVITNCSNNYGPYQFPEKLLPLLINNIRQGKKLPVYGRGENVRDWLYVEDHCEALDLVFSKKPVGETYNIGGDNEWQNIELVRKVCDVMDEKLSREQGTARELIEFVKDRKGHDFRYAIDTAKIREDLGWQPKTSMKEGLSQTIDWYLNNIGWLENVTSGAYKEYYRKQYQNRAQ